MLDGKTESGWVLDRCHDEIKVGDVFIADYRGTPDQRFTVLKDDRTGTLLVRRPDGAESLMRPSTILNAAKRIEHVDASELDHAIRTVRYIRENDCDFLTVDTLLAYGVRSEQAAQAALLQVMGSDWFEVKP